MSINKIVDYFSFYSIIAVNPIVQLGLIEHHPSKYLLEKKKSNESKTNCEHRFYSRSRK